MTMTKIIYFIIIVTFIDTFIQLPVMTPYAISLGATETMAGLIIAVYSALNVVGNIAGGYAVDRYGRKPVLVIGTVLSAAVLLFYPLVQDAGQLLLVRAVHGVVSGLLIPCVFAIAGDYAAKRSTKPMAYIGAGIGSAAILGPAAGGILAANGLTDAVFYSVAVLFAICIWLTVRYVSESFRERERRVVMGAPIMELLKHKKLQQASLAAFALMVSNGTLAFALPLKAGDLGLTQASAGIWLSIFGVTAVIIFVTKLNKIYDLYTSEKLTATGLITIGLILGLIQWITLPVVIPVLMFIYGIGFALIFPSMNQMVTDMSNKATRGKAFGIFYSFFSAGVVAGSSLAGFVSEKAGLPFTGGAALILTVSLIFIGIGRLR